MIKIEDSLKRVSWVDSVGNDDDDDDDDDDAVKYLSFIYLFIYLWYYNRRAIKEYQFWLFTDQLLYGTSTPLGLFTLHRQIPLIKCFVSTVDSITKDGHSFLVESPAKSFIVNTK